MHDTMTQKKKLSMPVICITVVYNQFKQTGKEKELFSLKGSKNASKRMALYTFLLNHMADEHRFQLTAKLCQVRVDVIIFGSGRRRWLLSVCS